MILNISPPYQLLNLSKYVLINIFLPIEANVNIIVTSVALIILLLNPHNGNIK